MKIASIGETDRGGAGLSALKLHNEFIKLGVKSVFHVNRKTSDRDDVAIIPNRASSDFAPFTVGHDVFGDGAVWAVPLPGHAPGQLGVLFTDQAGRTGFAVADACWTSVELDLELTPTFFSKRIIANIADYRATQRKLSQLRKRQP